MANREIKFRFFTPDKRMVSEHDGWVQGIGINEALEASKGYGYAIMQFTGLKDKKGVDIYEGDNVKGVWRGRTQDKNVYGTVDFKEGMFGIENILDNGEPYTLNRLCVEVVGNIYEKTG